ncbi:MAG: methylenetetrahydrofolate reductase [Planctomycetota bacterium]|nr:methylenetetrahydrofolate reductase [Planctomycetota bacterium]
MMEWNPEGSTILEIVPPTLKSGLEGLHRRLAKVRRLVEGGDFDAINIPEIHDEESRNDRGSRTRECSPRMQPRELGRRIQDELGIPVIVNHVVAFEPVEHLLEWAQETIYSHGIRNIILVGAPHDRRSWPGPPVAVANQALQKQFAGAELQIGNICIPERADSPISEALRMEEKARMGANFFSTQIVFEAREISSLQIDLDREAPCAREVPLLISLCPVKKIRQLDFLRFLGVRVPDSLEALLSTVPEAQCLDLSLEILGEIQSSLIDQQQKNSPPLGWNIAPVGPIPVSDIQALMQLLPGSVQS